MCFNSTVFALSALLDNHAKNELVNPCATTWSVSTHHDGLSNASSVQHEEIGACYGTLKAATCACDRNVVQRKLRARGGLVRWNAEEQQVLSAPAVLNLDS